MKYRLLLDELQREQLTDVLIVHVSDTAQAYSHARYVADRQEEVETKRAQFIRAQVLLDMVEEADAEQELLHTEGELQGMRDAGLDPLVELGARDPEAANRDCVHGIASTSSCGLCELDRLTPPGES